MNLYGQFTVFRQGPRAEGLLYVSLSCFPSNSWYEWDLGKLHIKKIMINDTEMITVLGRTAGMFQMVILDQTLILLFIIEKLPSHSMEHGVLRLLVFQWARVAKSTHLQMFLDSYCHASFDPTSYSEEIIFDDLT